MQQTKASTALTQASAGDRGFNDFDELLGMVRFRHVGIGFAARVALNLFADRTAYQEGFLMRFESAASFNQGHAVHTAHRIIGYQKNGAWLLGRKCCQCGIGIAKGSDCIPEGLKDNRGKLKQHRLVINDIN